MLFFRMYRNFFVFILCKKKKKCGVCFHRLISFFKAETFSWVFLSLPECSGGSLPSLLSPTVGTGLSIVPVSGFPLISSLPQGKVAKITGVIPTTAGPLYWGSRSLLHRAHLLSFLFTYDTPKTLGPVWWYEIYTVSLSSFQTQSS